MVRTWAVLLAAGASERFGSAKAFAPWKKGTLLSASLEKAKAICGENVLVVVGGHAQLICAALGKTAWAFNEDWTSGQGSSIACGFKAVLDKDPSAEQMMILTIDQPLVSLAHLGSLVHIAADTDCCAFTESRGIIGPPAVIRRSRFDRALALTGDKGMKSVLRADEMVAVASPEAGQDIDTPEDLHVLRTEFKLEREND